MRRAGGWTLALVAVIGMAAAGFLSLRPILFRKPLVVEFRHDEGWKPQSETGVRLAFTEKGFRAGGWPIQPKFDRSRGSPGSTSVLTVSRPSPEFWTVDAPASSLSGPRRLELLPQFDQLGGPAARWTKRKGIRRVFIPGFVVSGGFGAEFRRQAGPDGLDCTTDHSDPQGRSLLDAFRISKAELVILRRNDADMLTLLFKEAGFTGRYLIFGTGDSFFTPKPPPEGAFVVSPYVPDLASLTGRVPSAGPGPQPDDYLGYLMATLVLDAIDQTSSSDPAEIYQRLAKSAEFDAAGRSTLPGGLYVVKNGNLEFVELLR